MNVFHHQIKRFMESVEMISRLDKNTSKFVSPARKAKTSRVNLTNY